MGQLTNFINNNFDLFIAACLFWFIGCIVIIISARLREINTFRAINKLLYYIVIVGECVLILVLISTFQVNLKEKDFLIFSHEVKSAQKADFASHVLPTTQWVKDKIEIFFISENKLIAIKADGKNRRTVFRAESPIREYHFSPDGRQVLIITDNKLYRYHNETIAKELIDEVNIESAQDEKIKGVIGAVAWSPASDRFCYRKGQWTSFSSLEQWIIYDINEKKKQIIHHPQLRITELNWSEDGESLYYAWFNAMDTSVYANPYEVKIYKIPLSDPRPSLILKFPFDSKVFPKEHLALRGIAIFTDDSGLSFGRSGKKRYSWHSPLGDVIGVDEGDHLYFIRNHMWRREFLKFQNAYSKTEFSKQWDLILRKNKHLNNIVKLVKTWGERYSEKKWKIKSVDIPDKHKTSIWRRRLFKIPRIERESRDLARYQYEGGRLAIQYLRWFPSGRYVIMEHHFYGILVLDPSSGKIGVLINEKGNTFGWYSS